MQGRNVRAFTHELRDTLPYDWTHATARFVQDRKAVTKNLPAKATAKRAHSECPMIAGHQPLRLVPRIDPADPQPLRLVARKPIQDYRETEKQNEAARGSASSGSWAPARNTYEAVNKRQKRHS